MAKKETANKVMNKFIKDELKGVVNRINEKIKKDGFVFLESGEDFFYKPSDMNLYDYDTGKEYAKNQSMQKIGIDELEQYFECMVGGCTMDFFTDKNKYDEFVNEGFVNLMKKQNEAKFNERKQQLNIRLKSFQNQIDNCNMAILRIKDEMEALENERQNKV